MSTREYSIDRKKMPLTVLMPFIVMFCVLFLSSTAHADQVYSVDRMSGLYSGAWVKTAFDFTYYEPISGFADLKASKDAIMSDAVYYRYNKSMDLFVLIYRGFQDYEPTLDGIRNYVAGLGSTQIQDVSCNGMSAIQFMNQTDHYKELNIAFPDSDGAIIQVTVQCSHDDILYAFAQEVFSSVFPNAAADAYLSSVGEESVGHVYHLSDFGAVYQGSWVSLLDFFRFCAPSDAGWIDLTGTEKATSSDAIAMYQNDSLGIVIIIYYGFQPYNTTEGIYDALTARPEYTNPHYARCNGLKVVDFEKENRDHSIAFADSAGGIVQVTLQCTDPALRYLYSEQLFSSLIPADIHTSNGMGIPQEYKSFLSQSTVSAGDEVISLEGSRFSLSDVNSDGAQELLLRFPLEGSFDGLSDIYIFVLYDSQVRYAGKLRSAGSCESAGCSSKGYFFEESHDHFGLSWGWNVYRLSGTTLELVISFGIEKDPDSRSIKVASVNDQPVSMEAFNQSFVLYLDGTVTSGTDGFSIWDGYKGIPFNENTYFRLPISASPTESDTAPDGRTGHISSMEPSGLSEEEKKLFAGFLAEEDWLKEARGYDEEYSTEDDSPSVYEKDCWFSLIDVTGDGKEELAVCWNTWRNTAKGTTFFYQPADHDVRLIGKMQCAIPYTLPEEHPGYSSVSHLPYVYSLYEDYELEVRVMQYDSTGFNYRDIDQNQKEFNGDTVITLEQRRDFNSGMVTCHVNDSEVSFDEFVSLFRKYVGDPVPSIDDSEGWTGLETIASLENTPRNRMKLLGYTGGSDTWDYWNDPSGKGYTLIEDDYCSFRLPAEPINLLEKNSDTQNLSYRFHFADVDGDIGSSEVTAEISPVNIELLRGVAAQGTQYPGFEALFPGKTDIVDVLCLKQDDDCVELQVEYMAASPYQFSDCYRFISPDPSTGLCMQVHYKCWQSNHSETDYDSDFKAFYKTFTLLKTIDECSKADIVPITKVIYGPGFSDYISESNLDAYYLSASKIGGAYLEGKTDINDAAYDLGKIYELVKDRSEGDYEPSYLIAELRTQIMDGSVESAEIALENLILMASIDESQIY